MKQKCPNRRTCTGAVRGQKKRRGERLISSSQFWAGEVSIKKKRGEGEERQKRSMASLDIFRGRARLGKQGKSGFFILLHEVTQFYWTLLRKFVQRVKKLQKSR